MSKNCHLKCYITKQKLIGFQSVILYQYDCIVYLYRISSHKTRNVDIYTMYIQTWLSWYSHWKSNFQETEYIPSHQVLFFCFNLISEQEQKTQTRRHEHASWQNFIPLKKELLWVDTEHNWPLLLNPRSLVW